MRNRATFFAGTALMLLSGSAASPTTIATIGNPNLNALPGIGVWSQQSLSVSWTAEQSYRNVSIFVPLGQGSATEANPVYAYLTTRLGPGTTEANEIAHSLIYPTPASDPSITVFSGLDLGPGTYYLTLWSPKIIAGGWAFSLHPSVVHDDGVTIGKSQFADRGAGLDKYFGDNLEGPTRNVYIPSNYHVNLYPGEYLVFSVVANDDDSLPSEVPEPGSICLVGTGCFFAGLLLIRKMKRRI